MLNVSTVESLAGFDEVQVMLFKLPLLNGLLLDIFLLVLSEFAQVS